MAAHGCTGDDYSAADPSEIAAALESIAGEVVSCQFELDCADIPALDRVNFFYEPDHIPIPRDVTRASGWDWIVPCEGGATTGMVEFFGVDCDNILAGTYESITAEFGCPTII
jgi:hypothetical protein